jgi:hypothetical protein
MLPKELRPSKLIFAGTIVAGLFFAGFAIVYLLQLVGILGTGSSS